MKVLCEVGQPDNGNPQGRESCASPCAVAISSKNLIAFTSDPTIMSRARNTLQLPSDYLNAAVAAVCVCDVSRPWDVSMVTMAPTKISQLSWNAASTALLLAEYCGRVYVFTMQENMLNCWTCQYVSTHSFDQIITLKWFHNSTVMKVSTDPDVKAYQEKYPVCQSYTPTLGNLYGRVSEGWLCVTASGLVIAAVLKTERKAILAKTQLPYSSGPSSCQEAILSADICFNPDGSLLLAYTSGSITSPISLARINVSVAGGGARVEVSVEAVRGLFLESPNITPSPLPTPSLGAMASPAPPSPDSQSKTDHWIQTVRFFTEHSPGMILVGINTSTSDGRVTDVSKNASILELWTMKLARVRFVPAIERIASIAAGAKMDAGLTRQVWSRVAQRKQPSSLVYIAPPKMELEGIKTQSKLIVGETDCAPDFQNVIVSYADSSMEEYSVTGLTTETTDLTTETTSSEYVPGLPCSSTGTGEGRFVLRSRQTLALPASRIDQSPTGAVCTGLTTGSHAALIITKMTHDNSDESEDGDNDTFMDCGTRTEAKDTGSDFRRCLLLFEYCLYAGLDWQDVLLLLPPGSEELMISRLDSRFHWQRSEVQATIQTRPFQIKLALYIKSGHGLHRAYDSFITLLLQHVRSMLAQELLGGSQDTPPEQSLHARLNKICSISPDNNIHSIGDQFGSLCPISDNRAATVSALVQWVADLSLYLLTLLPKCSAPTFSSSSRTRHATGGSAGSASFTGVSLIRTPSFLLNLKELLLLCHVWERGAAPAHRPVFICSPDARPLADMYGAVSGLYACSQREARGQVGGIIGSASSEVFQSIVEDCAVFTAQMGVPSVEKCLSSFAPPPGLAGSGGVSDKHVFGEKEWACPPALTHPLVARFTNCKKDVFRQVFLASSHLEKQKECVRCGSRCSVQKGDKTSSSADVALQCLCSGLWMRVTSTS